MKINFEKSKNKKNKKKRQAKQVLSIVTYYNYDKKYDFTSTCFNPPKN